MAWPLSLNPLRTKGVHNLILQDRQRAAVEQVERPAHGLDDDCLQATFVGSALVRELRGALAASEAARPPERPARLTAREVEVLRLLVAGYSDREIAERLFISPRTASKHVGAILAKLEVVSRGEAAVFAVRHGLV